MRRPSGRRTVLGGVRFPCRGAGGRRQASPSSPRSPRILRSPKHGRAAVVPCADAGRCQRGQSPAELESFLINFVVEQTGYPTEVVELDADLEADLGIDSIKKAQLFGELRGVLRRDAVGKPDAGRLSHAAARAELSPRSPGRVPAKPGERSSAASLPVQEAPAASEASPSSPALPEDLAEPEVAAVPAVACTAMPPLPAGPMRRNWNRS